MLSATILHDDKPAEQAFIRYVHGLTFLYTADKLYVLLLTHNHFSQVYPYAPYNTIPLERVVRNSAIFTEPPAGR